MLEVELAIAGSVYKRIGARWFWGLIAAVCVVIFLIARISGPDQVIQLKNNRDLIRILLNVIAIFLVIVTCATEIPRDFSSGIILIILAKPIERYQVVLGKFVGTVAIGCSFMGLTSVFAAVVLWIMGLTPDAASVGVMAGGMFRVFLATAMTSLAAVCLPEMLAMAFGVLYVAISHLMLYFTVLMKSSSVVKIFLSFAAYLAPNMLDFVLPDTWIAEQFWGAEVVAATAARDAGLAIEGMFANTLTTWASFGMAGLYTAVYTMILIKLAMIIFKRRVIT